MSLNETEIAELRAELQKAIVQCSERCLYQAAKWAAELLNSIPELPSSNANATPVVVLINADPDEAALEAQEISKYLLAKSFFDCREYDRCAAVFLPDSVLTGILATNDLTSGGPSSGKGKAKATADSNGAALPIISQKSLFLALYAKIMSGEKKKDEDTEMVMGPQDNGVIINKQLLSVSRFLEKWFQGHLNEEGEYPESQGWLEYGMVFAKQKNETQAMKWFIESVHRAPMNWGCWLEMTSLISRIEEFNEVVTQLPQNIMSFMFQLHAHLELYQTGEGLQASLQGLLEIFPTSSFLLTCNALLAYHSKDFVNAEQCFSHLLALHPHRLDALDHYSNILHVMAYRPKLAFLAHLCSSIDKFRPESCVVIGNYYSLLSMHEKAVQYFRRALTLDRSCLSAWTLMGHEYVELKNTHAAIESYRRAVDINRKDYRAWYGLGQTYEVLEMHSYALWYYKKAAGLRPWDNKMWMAVGSCLQKMGRDRDGIKALKRALLADYNSAGSAGESGQPQLDPEILLQIANMYERLGEDEEAKGYMEMCVAQEDGGALGGDGTNLGESMAVHSQSADDSDDEDQGANEGTGVTAATSKARMWLAKFAMREGEHQTAYRLATELCQDGVEVEEAKALIREARSHMDEVKTWPPG
ncbi:hypothetical protein MKZ38_010658 [Zalerion maritima]|uniref:Cdc23 domain-containing protein n=1 Tax=Zalerion maritima TaxID=339359 RepID=A0AAD5RSY0_9PEZI|nr:hypothetical protein MKZ38_010658 [Zalerion maritima]